MVSVPPLAEYWGHDPGTCWSRIPYVVLGDPRNSWIVASNVVGVTVSRTDPTARPVSLVFVVQSPVAGLTVPRVTVRDEVGSEVVVVDDDVDVVVGVCPPPQADTRADALTVVATARKARVANDDFIRTNVRSRQGTD